MGSTTTTKQASTTGPFQQEMLEDLYGRTTEIADTPFAAYTDPAGPTGLMAEEVDPASGRALGNHPQAYSHLGLISNALNLAALGG